MTSFSVTCKSLFLHLVVGLCLDLFGNQNHLSVMVMAIRRVNENVDSRRSTRNVTDHFFDPPRRTNRVNVMNAKEPNDHLVTEPLPLTKEGNDFQMAHWAGHLPASNDGEKYFFYWLFEPEVLQPHTPLLIWLNGGPACSSMDGLFLENGPIQWTMVDGKYKLQQNPYSWHKAPAYTLYIDQPVGTGLSFTTNHKYPTNDHEVNTDFYYFLTSFFQLHADKFVEGGAVSRPVYFSGESHAGHYIPSMMNFILKENRQGTWPMIPLAGAAIGNGFFDPIHQYSAAEAAYGHGLIGRAELYSFQKNEQKCQQLLSSGQGPSRVCYALLDDVVDQSFGTQSQHKVSPYDVRLTEKKGSPRKFPKGHAVIEAYLGGWTLPDWENEGTIDTAIMESVLKVIHAEAATQAGQRYKECTDPPYDALADQDGFGVVSDIVQVLQDPSKPRLLFFNGIEDLICNHVGNERALENLPWHGREEWVTAQRFAFFDNPHSTEPAGYLKQHDNLLFLKLSHAGHMAALDLPDVSLNMMKVFLAKGSFASSRQDVDSAATKIPKSCSLCKPCAETFVCPKCTDIETRSPSHDCSAQIAKAQEEAIASLSDNETSGGGSLVMVVGAVLIVMGLLAEMTGQTRISRRRRQVGFSNDHVELPTQYRDHNENERNDGDNEMLDNGLT